MKDFIFSMLYLFVALFGFKLGDYLISEVKKKSGMPKYVMYFISLLVGIFSVSLFYIAAMGFADIYSNKHN